VIQTLCIQPDLLSYSLLTYPMLGSRGSNMMPGLHLAVKLPSLALSLLSYHHLPPTAQEQLTLTHSIVCMAFLLRWRYARHQVLNKTSDLSGPRAHTTQSWASEDNPLPAETILSGSSSSSTMGYWVEWIPVPAPKTQSHWSSIQCESSLVTMRDFSCLETFSLRYLPPVPHSKVWAASSQMRVLVLLMSQKK
jgi:hypothetical protein